jgi:hypothetical protein
MPAVILRILMSILMTEGVSVAGAKLNSRAAKLAPKSKLRAALKLLSVARSHVKVEMVKSPQNNAKVIDAKLTKQGNLVLNVDADNVIRKVSVLKDELRKMIISKANAIKSNEVEQDVDDALLKSAQNVKENLVMQRSAKNVKIKKESAQRHQNSAMRSKKRVPIDLYKLKELDFG